VSISLTTNITEHRKLRFRVKKNYTLYLTFVTESSDYTFAHPTERTLPALTSMAYDKLFYTHTNIYTTFRLQFRDPTGIWVLLGIRVPTILSARQYLEPVY